MYVCWGSPNAQAPTVGSFTRDDFVGSELVSFAATDVVQVGSIFEGEAPHIFVLSSLNEVAPYGAH